MNESTCTLSQTLLNEKISTSVGWTNQEILAYLNKTEQQPGAPVVPLSGGTFVQCHHRSVETGECLHTAEEPGGGDDITRLMMRIRSSFLFEVEEEQSEPNGQDLPIWG